jgi:hypothetical protein
VSITLYFAVIRELQIIEASVHVFIEQTHDLVVK